MSATGMAKITMTGIPVILAWPAISILCKRLSIKAGESFI